MFRHVSNNQIYLTIKLGLNTLDLKAYCVAVGQEMRTGMRRMTISLAGQHRPQASDQEASDHTQDSAIGSKSLYHLPGTDELVIERQQSKSSPVLRTAIYIDGWSLTPLWHQQVTD